MPRYRGGMSGRGELMVRRALFPSESENTQHNLESNGKYKISIAIHCIPSFSTAYKITLDKLEVH